MYVKVCVRPFFTHKNMYTKRAGMGDISYTIDYSKLYTYLMYTKYIIIGKNVCMYSCVSALFFTHKNTYTKRAGMGDRSYTIDYSKLYTYLMYI